MTRSHKFNDRDHSGEAESHEQVPKYFAKTGFVDTDPKKTKKDGGGKGNWGHPGDEVQDTNYAMNNPRRRSNSSSHSKFAKDFKTKFEIVEAEPVFEMSEHGPTDEDSDHVRLEHQSTTSTSSEAQSIEEEQN